MNAWNHTNLRGVAVAILIALVSTSSSFCSQTLSSSHRCFSAVWATGSYIPLTFSTRRGSFMRNIGMAGGTTNKVDNNGAENKSNWNAFTKDTSSALPPRVRWSESQYEDALQLYERLIHCEDSYVSGPIKAALECLDGAYRIYGQDQVIGSYNGGKDAVAAVHLMRAAHAAHHRKYGEKHDGEDGGSSHSSSLPPHRPRVIYFDNAEEFPEVRHFLTDTVEAYDLDMVAFDDSHSFSEGIRCVVEDDRINKNVARPIAFVLGTRMGDPNAGEQGTFAPSSDWMGVPFMRVNPLIRWTYGEVWHFLRLFGLPYCSLYDVGYTSLGNTRDTLKCPALERPQGGYWPAYMLTDYSQERAGRIPKGGSAADVVSRAETRRSRPPLSVGLIIIGDEILKGRIADTNSHAAATALRSRQITLSRVSVIPDDHDSIVDEIHRTKALVDVVITSGGVGPTHDDVTILAVATALSSPLVVHPEMVALINENMENRNPDGDRSTMASTEVQAKMTLLPQNAKLRYLGSAASTDGTTDHRPWPTLQCGYIFILPGVPSFFKDKVEGVASHLSSLSTNRVLLSTENYRIVLRVEEAAIVEILNRIVARHSAVLIGSYPFVEHSEYKTILTLEGNATMPIDDQEDERMEDAVDKMDLQVKLALEDLLRELPEGSVIRVDNDNKLL